MDLPQPEDKEVVKCEAQDVRGNIVIIRVNDPQKYDASLVTRGFMRAGATMVLLCKPDDVIETMSPEQLSKLGLKLKKKPTWSALVLTSP